MEQRRKRQEERKKERERKKEKRKEKERKRKRKKKNIVVLTGFPLLAGTQDPLESRIAPVSAENRPTLNFTEVGLGLGT